MYYPNRQTVGDLLAPKLKNFSNNETIIFCLKKSSLLSCIELAAHLHAYIYVLQYSEVSDPYNITRLLGVVTSSGEFVLNPEISQFEYDYIFSEFQGAVEQRRQDAFSQVNQQNLNPKFDLKNLNHRNVILFADILDSTFQVHIALDFLKSYIPKCVHGVFGNTTSEVFEKFIREADGCTFIDTLNSTFFDDDHYFEQPDPYSEDQEVQMANNISLYWA